MFHLQLASMPDAPGDALAFEEMPFSAGRPSTSFFAGTLRLFRDRAVGIDAAMGRSRVLCIIAVPSVLGAAEFCAFLGPLLSAVEHMRILRSPRTPGRYSVLLRFATHDAADRCYRAYHGRPFSSLQPGATCRALFVAAVRLEPSSGGSASGGMPPEGDPLLPPAPEATHLVEAFCGEADGGCVSTPSSLVELPTCPVCLERLESSASGMLTTLCNHTFHCACLAGWGDDSCPVCRHCAWQEDDEDGGDGLPSRRGDGSGHTETGVVGFSASRTEAPTGDALAAVAGAIASSAVDDAPRLPSSVGEGGPSPPIVGAGVLPSPPSVPSSTAHPTVRTTFDPPAPPPSASSVMACESCGLRRDLWMCLICGRVACGRYSKGHAVEHYAAHGGHCYAIEVATQRVWDYAQDNFVHRLLQNRRDGKLVELPDGGVPTPASASSFLLQPPYGRGSGGTPTQWRTQQPTSGGSDGPQTGDGGEGLSCGGGGGGDTNCSSSAAVDSKGSTPAHYGLAVGGGSGPASAFTGSAADRELESLSFEYTLLLTSQLESQRAYFENQLASLLTLLLPTAPPHKRRAAEALLFAHHGHSTTTAAGQALAAAVSSPSAAAAAEAAVEVAPAPDAADGDALQRDLLCASLRADVASARVECAAAHAAASAAEARATAAERDRKAALKKASAWRERSETLSEELAFLRDLHESHTGNVAQWTARVEAAEVAAKVAAERVTTLEEEARDLMFALDTKEAVAASPELAGGSFVGIEGGAPPPKAARGRKGGRGGGAAGAGGATVSPAVSPAAAAAAAAAADAAAAALLADEEKAPRDKPRGSR